MTLKHAYSPHPHRSVFAAQTYIAPYNHKDLTIRNLNTFLLGKNNL